MLEVIEKLLILQDRDRKIERVRLELANVGPERASLQGRLGGAQAALDAAKLRSKQIESDRKKLELDAEAKKALIEKYSVQQFQTKKNDEYRALAKEIETCKGHIVGLEDQQLELMEQADKAAREVSAASAALAEAKAVVDRMLADLGQREVALQRELADLEKNHQQLLEGIEEGGLTRYLRLRKTKGGSAVVGIDHGVCGGCHMKLPIQIVRSCQGQQEIVSCPNCGRILYYSPHMDLVAAD